MNYYEEQLTALIMQIDSYLAHQHELTTEQSPSEVMVQSSRHEGSILQDSNQQSRRINTLAEINQQYL